jgi:hypothetical protein
VTRHNPSGPSLNGPPARAYAPPGTSAIASQQRCDATPPPSGGSGSAGLVSLSTSGTALGAHTLSLGDLRIGRVRRGLLSGAQVVEEDLQNRAVRYRAAMITLTYRPGVGWSPRHLSAAVSGARKYCARRGWWFRYCWRLEFHASGRPHYHVVCWLPKGVTLPMFDRQGWWPHGMTNAVWARRPVGYLAKYASKATDWPPGTCGTRGARWFGFGGLSLRLRLRARWRAAPAWIRALGWEDDVTLGREGSRWRVGPWLMRSPWRVLEVAGGLLQFEWRGWDESSAVLA